MKNNHITIIKNYNEKSKKPQEEQKSMGIDYLTKFITRTGNKQDKNQKGSFEFSLGDLFKCVCCIHSGISYEEKRLNEINESLQQINKHLSLLDRFVVLQHFIYNCHPYNYLYIIRCK